jgi:hypothetical protein
MEVVGSYLRFGPGDTQRPCSECGQMVFVSPKAESERVVCKVHAA